MSWTPDADQYAAIRAYTESVEAERDAYRVALEIISREWQGQLGTGKMLSDFCGEVLERKYGGEKA